MQLPVHARSQDLPTEARSAIERRIRLALGRHAAGIDRAQVTLSPAQDGGNGSRCRIHVRLRRGESLAIEDHAADPHAAAAAAAWRLEHRLERRRATLRWTP